MALVCDFSTIQMVLMALRLISHNPNSTQTKLSAIQIVHMPQYEKLLIQIVHMAHIRKNDMIQIKDMFQIEATT